MRTTKLFFATTIMLFVLGLTSCTKQDLDEERYTDETEESKPVDPGEIGEDDI